MYKQKGRNAAAVLVSAFGLMLMVVALCLLLDVGWVLLVVGALSFAAGCTIDELGVRNKQTREHEDKREDDAERAKQIVEGVNKRNKR